MMTDYQSPQLDVIELNMQDIITKSTDPFGLDLDWREGDPMKDDIDWGFNGN